MFGYYIAPPRLCDVIFFSLPFPTIFNMIIKMSLKSPKEFIYFKVEIKNFS